MTLVLSELSLSPLSSLSLCLSFSLSLLPHHPFPHRQLLLFTCIKASFIVLTKEHLKDGDGRTDRRLWPSRWRGNGFSDAVGVTDGDGRMERWLYEGKADGQVSKHSSLRFLYSTLTTSLFSLAALFAAPTAAASASAFALSLLKIALTSLYL